MKMALYMLFHNYNQAIIPNTIAAAPADTPFLTAAPPDGAVMMPVWVLDPVAEALAAVDEEREPALVAEADVATLALEAADAVDSEEALETTASLEAEEGMGMDEETGAVDEGAGSDEETCAVDEGVGSDDTAAVVRAAVEAGGVTDWTVLEDSMTICGVKFTFEGSESERISIV